MSIFLDKKKYVLMSIKPVYATFIKNGKKQLNCGVRYLESKMAM